MLWLIFSGDGLVDVKVERERSDTPDSLAGYDYMTLGKIVRRVRRPCISLVNTDFDKAQISTYLSAVRLHSICFFMQ